MSREVLVTGNTVVGVTSIYRTQGNNVEYWANRYEYTNGSSNASVPENIAAFANALVPIMRGLVKAEFLLDRIVVSTYAPDGETYLPNTMAIRQVGLPGTLPIPGAAMPLESTLVVRKIAANGRNGFILLRGALDTLAFTSTAGLSELKPEYKGIVQPNLNALLIVETDTTTWNMVMARGDTDLFGLLPIGSRFVEQLVPTKIGSKKLNSPRKLATSVVSAASTILGAAVEGGVPEILVDAFRVAFNALPFKDLPALPAPAAFRATVVERVPPAEPAAQAEKSETAEPVAEPNV